MLTASNRSETAEIIQESLALASIARDDSPASSTVATMRGKVRSEFET